ncbi:MAG: HDIG domain-containing protein [Clostridiales bacterium]|nr:HDIG domain-containing protein [Clostridiales bacterium]
MAILVPLVAQPLVIMSSLALKNVSIDILWNVLFCYGAGVLSAMLFMPIVALFEGIFNIADDFRLSELCNLSNPLLKRLASEAPGTFNHSLVVGTIAEACASAIGENPNLARCAAYYHDIGKLKAPLYFSENQSDYNPHDELIPEVSVSMITSHTLFGEILAKQNRLPSEIVGICRQHHGTAPVSYFFNKANNLQEEGTLAQDNYTYAGPKPQTKIAAIIMICDTVEAAIRSFTPETREGYFKRIEMLVDDKIRLRQFDECPITLGDIAIIKKTLMESLVGMHHGRIDYDKKKRAKSKG